MAMIFNLIEKKLKSFFRTLQFLYFNCSETYLLSLILFTFFFFASRSVTFYVSDLDFYLIVFRIHQTE